MSLSLSSPVTDLPRVGPAKAGFLKKLGITHLRDLLFMWPRRYDDFSTITNIKDLKIGERATVRGRVKSVRSVWGWQGRRRLLRIYVEIEDDTGVLRVTWFNLQFLAKQLWDKRELYVAGTVEKDKSMRSPVLEFVTAEADTTHTARITPVYPETFGVTSRWLRYQVKQLLPLIEAVPEYLPAGIRARQQLMGIHDALRLVHFPTTTAELDIAQKRLRFDEIFFLQLAALVRRQQVRRATAPALSISKKTLKTATAQLPFSLTPSQQQAIKDILADVAQAWPMNRLLHGDVGSGKSAVALLVTAGVLQAGHQVLYLAPTEILARQQAEHFSGFLGQNKVALLVGSLSARTKQAIKQRLRTGEVVCIVGTQALLQEDVMSAAVALVIVDEQHRFGVAQRAALQQRHVGPKPHLLSMTATPIPRTLTLTVYGDLDVSPLTELPPGRQPICTQVVAPAEREAVIIKILGELHRGRQAYVVAPLIERSQKLEVKSATETYEEMQQLFPGIAIGLLHGQLSSVEKDSVMRSFAAGALQLLVATAVVEVGVNVPNATCLIIEGAERFGLAQLHQLRGRVGRGQEQSYCYLFASTAEGAANPRLKTLAATTDGFAIAEADLELRGPGEVYGQAQSGFDNLKVASLLDYPTITAARQEAQGLLQADPDLREHVLLKRKVEQKNAIVHFE